MKRTWKRVLSLLLAACMMTSFAAAAAFDDEVRAETPTGEEAVDLFAADTGHEETPLYAEEEVADLAATDETADLTNVIRQCAFEANSDRGPENCYDGDYTTFWGQNNGAIVISSDVDKLEYRAKPTDGADPAYTNATATIGNLSAGWYQFRYKETGTHYASDITEVEIRVLTANAKDLTISEDIPHGSVTAVREKVNPGDTVKLTVTPDLGCELTAITAHYGDSQSITPKWNEETKTYHFTMPDAAVNVTAAFALITYTIDYQWEGVADGSFTVEDTSITLATAERDDHTFTGWSLTEDGAALSDVTAAMLIAGAENKIVKLYPVWELIPADKDALAAAIEAAEAVRNDNYTTASWNDFQKALSDAKDVLANAEATQTETDNALSTLTTAQNGLKKQSSSGGGSSRPSTPADTTTTETKEDGTKVTTVTKPDGTKVETTETSDGTKAVVETKPDGSKTQTVEQADGTKSEMEVTKDGDVTITVTNESGEELVKTEIPAEIPEPETKFEDVTEAAPWAEEAIDKMAGLKLVNGTGDNKYNPVAPMTRGSLATVLHRLSQGKTDYEVTFKDVAEGKYYTEGVAWAAKANVVKGVSEDVFAPDTVITREQLAVMLARYAKLIGMDTKADAHRLSVFTDGDSTGDWAVDGVAWCVENGILKGKGQNNLDPTADVTRAEVAVMLDRFIGLIK